MSGPDPTPDNSTGALRRNLLRLLVLIVAVLLIRALMGWTEDLAQNHPKLMLGVLAMAFAAYILLMALPFVPAIEIGIALMLLEGRDLVPWVYLATALGLLLSFAVGQFTPLSALHRLFADLKLYRAGALIDKIERTPAPMRLSIFEALLPRLMQPFFIQGRYVLVALALNIPGNALIGGGGGILLIAGLSRVFHPILMALTVLIAVAPVPLSILLLGIDPAEYFSQIPR